MYWPNLKSVAVPVTEIKWGAQKIWAVPGYAHASFSPIVFMGFCSRLDPRIVLAKFEVRSFTRSRDNSDWSFGSGANPNLGPWGRRGRRGSGMVPLERALVSSYRPP